MKADDEMQVLKAAKHGMLLFFARVNVSMIAKTKRSRRCMEAQAKPRRLSRQGPRPPSLNDDEQA